MLFSPLVAVLLMTLAQPSHEVTTFDDDTMETLLNDGGVGLAMSYAPVWNFGQPQNQAGYSPPCYPTWAFEGSPTTNDTYDLAHQTPGAGLCPYPDVGCSCRNPGVPVGTEAPPFPIYYTYERCSSTEVRVLYNLFYEKDGASGAIKTGHPYDWESVVVIFQKNWHWNQWYLLWEPYLLFLGYHGKYNRGSSRGYWTQAWTVSNEDVLNGNIIGNNQAKWEDHPKVYPSWSKHANFDRPYRGPLDAIDQSTMSAYRSDEWWNFVDSNYYIRADSSTEAGQALLAADWQGATSVPPKVHEGICKIKAQYLHDELFVIPYQDADPVS